MTSATLHIVGLPHTHTTSEHVGCAYTSKIVKGCRMFTESGYDVILYSGEKNEAVCAKHIPVVKLREQAQWFGTTTAADLPAITWDFRDPWWRAMNRRAAAEIRQRADANDLVLLLGGQSQAPLAESLRGGARCIEWGVGYEGIIGELPCAFESQAWMHTVYAKRGINDGRWLEDVVIPNFFDLDDFPHVNQGDGDYLLFVGRLVTRKGPHVAAQIAQHAGMRLIVAGAGTIEERNGVLTVFEPGGWEATLPGDVEYVGPIDAAQRAELMAGARALLAPTTYIEPFGGVAVEAQLCGTPAITPPWGAFTETVDARWHFRTLAEALEAVDRAADVDHAAIRDQALSRYGLGPVGRQYTRWFRRIATLDRGGWYEPRQLHS